MGHLHIPDLIVIGLYLLGVAAVGFWCARKQTTTEEYFLAGRRTNGVFEASGNEMMGWGRQWEPAGYGGTRLAASVGEERRRRATEF